MYFLCCSMYFCVLCVVCFVTFPVLFVCICVLNDCHLVATQLQLNISYHYSDIYIYIYTQRDATLHSLLYLETALHVSGGTSTHHQERMQLYLQHLVFVRPLMLPVAIVEEMELLGVPSPPR